MWCTIETNIIQLFFFIYANYEDMKENKRHHWNITILLQAILLLNTLKIRRSFSKKNYEYYNSNHFLDAMSVSIIQNIKHIATAPHRTLINCFIQIQTTFFSNNFFFSSASHHDTMMNYDLCFGNAIAMISQLKLHILCCNTINRQTHAHGMHLNSDFWFATNRNRSSSLSDDYSIEMVWVQRCYIPLLTCTNRMI